MISSNTGIHIVEIKWSYNCLLCTMGSPISIKQYPHTELSYLLFNDSDVIDSEQINLWFMKWFPYNWHLPCCECGEYVLMYPPYKIINIRHRNGLTDDFLVWLLEAFHGLYLTDHQGGWPGAVTDGTFQHSEDQAAYLQFRVLRETFNPWCGKIILQNITRAA